MPLLTKVGSFAKPAGSGTQIITGVGFQPKAIIFWLGGGEVSGTWRDHTLAGIGFTTGPSNSYAISASSRDAVTTSSSLRRMAAKAISQSDFNGGLHEADLTSLNPDGFTLTWGANNSGVNMQINYLAIGGSDVTGANVVQWTGNSGAGNQAVTGAGFKPDLVFHATPSQGGPVTSSNPSANFVFGVMNAHGQQWSNSFSSQNAITGSNSSRWQQTDACIANVANGETIGTQSHFISMDTNGFTVNHSTGGGINVISLCLQGVSSKIGSFSKTPAAAPTVQSVDRIGFFPKAVINSSFATNASAAPVTSALWSMGASDGTNERSSMVWEGDALNPVSSKSMFRSDKSFYYGGRDSGVMVNVAEGNVQSLNPDGFSVNWTLNSVTEVEYLYVALGDAGTATSPLKANPWSATDDATATGNQRKLDRFSNGNLIGMYQEAVSGGLSDNWNINVSTDNGRTWSYISGLANVQNGSIFVDQDDYIHFVFKAGNAASDSHGTRSANLIYYMRGTPNLSRTSWTWATPLSLNSLSGADSSVEGYNYPDVVAHREGAGWNVHIVASMSAANPINYTLYQRIYISSAGVMTRGDAEPIDFSSTNNWGYIGGSYGVNAPTHPSIDFNHTGDGKTISGAPHLYVSWSSGKTGTGGGVRFRKAVYSNGAWTWNAEREIDTSRTYDGGDRVVTCMFDGARVSIAGTVNLSGSTTDELVIFERDAADTTTTPRILETGGTYARLYKGSTTYDSQGNIYFFGEKYAGAFSDLYMQKWTRETNTLGARVQLETGFYNRYVSAKRGSSHGRVEWLYTSGNNGPYTVKYDSHSTTILGQLIRAAKTMADLVRAKFVARGIKVY